VGSQKLALFAESKGWISEWVMQKSKEDSPNQIGFFLGVWWIHCALEYTWQSHHFKFFIQQFTTTGLTWFSVWIFLCFKNPQFWWDLNSLHGRKLCLLYLKATCTSLAKDVNFVVTCKLTKFVFGNESKQGCKEVFSVT
jgi:hypothetical protein